MRAHRGRASRRCEAALEGAKQIGFTIVSITVSLLAVFVPILLMGGIVGRLFREFAVTLSVAVADVGARLADADADDVLAPAALGGRTWRTGALYRAFERVFDAHARVLRARPALGAAPPHDDAARHARHRGAQRRPLRRRPEGALPAAGHRPAHGDHRGRAGRLVPRDDAAADAGQRDPRRRTRTSTTTCRSSARAASARATRATAFITLKPKPPRKATADEVIARLRAQAREDRGHHDVPAVARQDVSVGGRAGRTQYQYTSRTRTSTSCVTWAPKVLDALQKAPAAQGRRHRPADRRARARRRHRPRHRLAPRRHRAGDRRRALRRLRPARSWRRPSRSSTSTTSCSRRPSRTATTPDSLDGIYVQEHHRRRGAAARHRQDAPTHDRALGQPPRAVPGGDHLVQPRAERVARPGGRRHRQGRAATMHLPPSVHAELPGHGAGVHVVAQNEPLLIARRAPRRLHRARACSTRATSTRSRSSRRCRRRASARCVALMLFGVDLSIIAHHRPPPAHRHREEERHPAHRLRHRGRAQRGALARGRDRARLLAALPAHPDDDVAALFGALPLAFGTGSAPSCGGRSGSPSSAGCSPRSC